MMDHRANAQQDSSLVPQLSSISSRRFRPYLEYVETNQKWLPKLPKGWEALRFKRVARLMYGDSLPVEEREPGEVLVYGSNGPVGEHSCGNTFAPVLVIGRKGSYGKINYTYEPVFAIDTTYFVDTRSSGVQLRWLFYATQLLGLDTYSEDSAIPGLSRDFVYSLTLPVPTVSEQRAIAEFLDRETGKIDALVAKKERLIQLLQEKRTALITRAATKGLDPHILLKDSGVEWLGKIPAHWTVERTKFVARLESGHTPSRQHSEYWENCTIPWFGLVDVWQIRDGRREYVDETNEKISELGLAHSSARLLPKGTVILSRTASVGFSAIMGVDMATTQDFVNWICGSRIRPEYLLYVFRGMGPEFQRLTMGSTHQTIYMPDVSSFFTSLPPVEEQDRIVAYIRTELTKIDCLIDKIREGIDRLREFRTALISAAVTGKIDVREEVA